MCVSNKRPALNAERPRALMCFIKHDSLIHNLLSRKLRKNNWVTSRIVPPLKHERGADSRLIIAECVSEALI